MSKVLLRLVTILLLAALLLISFMSLRLTRRLPNSVIYLVQNNETSFTLEPVARRLSNANLEEQVLSIITALQAGPTAAEKANNLSTALSQDLSINSVQIIADQVTIDLSRELELGGGMSLMMARLYQLFYSIENLEGVNRVSLYLDGERIISFGQEGIVIENPWSRPSEALPVW